MNFIAKDSGASAVLTDRSYYWSMTLNRTRDRISSLSLSSLSLSSLSLSSLSLSSLSLSSLSLSSLSIASFSRRRDAVSTLKWIVSTNANSGCSGVEQAHCDLLFLQERSCSKVSSRTRPTCLRLGHSWTPGT
jgi:hypothetical protein